MARLPSFIFYLLPLAWLWFRLIDHLRVEWSVNPQYAYGWAVPFLCAYLLWRRVAQASPPACPSGIPAAETCPVVSSPAVRSQKSEVSSPVVSGHVVLWSLALCAFLYAPTRLIQEANPEWRFVSWALALEVVAITLLLLRITGYGPQTTDHGPLADDYGSGATDHVSRITHHASWLSAFCFSGFQFPILFFLVAVPWPTFVEAPLVQGLMRANIGVTIELLSAFGVPAVQHGNVIEIANGMVGIDEACSGIRSLQATLMLSLFFGEVYRLAVRRRLWLVVSGFVLAFAFNLGRTLLLTGVASAKGVGAVAAWHDPAGVAILVACFFCLWLIARAFQKAESTGQRTEDRGQRVAQASSPASSASIPAGKFPDSPTQSSKLDVRGSMFDARPACPSSSLSAGGEGWGEVAPPSSIFVLRPPFPWSSSLVVPLSLSAWLLVVEGGTEAWYRVQESRLPRAAAWSVEFPRDNPTFRESPLPEAAKRLLRSDEGVSASWTEAGPLQWQVIYLRWNPGRAARYLAELHTPQICMPSAGFRLRASSPIELLSVNGAQLPFRSYLFEQEGYYTHVFYCRWEDRPNKKTSFGGKPSRIARLQSVWTGRGNGGQRVLEVAIRGIVDRREAEAALVGELGKLIKLEK